MEQTQWMKFNTKWYAVSWTEYESFLPICGMLNRFLKEQEFEDFCRQKYDKVMDELKCQKRRKVFLS